MRLHDRADVVFFYRQLLPWRFEVKFRRFPVEQHLSRFAGLVTVDVERMETDEILIQNGDGNSVKVNARIQFGDQRLQNFWKGQMCAGRFGNFEDESGTRLDHSRLQLRRHHCYLSSS